MQHGFNDKGGSDSNILTTDELPAHTHDVTDPGHTHGYIISPWTDDHNFSFDRNPQGADTPNNNGPGTTLPSKTGISISNTGSNLGHNNQPPYYVLSYIMKL
jgi:microcystin-dependent protein